MPLDLGEGRIGDYVILAGTPTAEQDTPSADAPEEGGQAASGLLPALLAVAVLAAAGVLRRRRKG